MTAKTTEELGALSYVELSALMRELDIAAPLQDGPTLTRRDGWEYNAYRFALDVRGERLMSNAPYRTGLPTPATGADFLGALIADIQSVEPYAVSDEDEEHSVMAQERAVWPPNWDQWADDLGLVTDARSARKAAVDFREIMARRWLLRDRLGAADFARLLDVEL